MFNTNKQTYITRSFTVSIGDLIFQVQPNVLHVAQNFNGQQVVLKTEVREEDMAVLESFSAKARDILAPMPNNEVIYSINEGPQKITLVRTEHNHYVLIINNQIQFTTDSEIIYHEALVSPSIASSKDPKKFLILGGGDGLAAKQIYKEVPDADIVLVDFDKNITDIFTKDTIMQEFNDNSMEKCLVINEDAFEFVKTHKETYDVIICDFPDPDQDIFNKLYSLEFYLELKKLLNKNGLVSVQSGSLTRNNNCFVCINRTLQAAGFKTIKYYTPTSYGELVYSLGKLEDVPSPVFNNKLETITQEFFDKAMSTFRPDHLLNDDVKINTVENFAAFTYRKSELKLD
jgi:spermidine synthase